jgi:Ca-activated chloride channel family protein
MTKDRKQQDATLTQDQTQKQKLQDINQQAQKNQGAKQQSQKQNDQKSQSSSPQQNAPAIQSNSSESAPTRPKDSRLVIDQDWLIPNTNRVGQNAKGRPRQQKKRFETHSGEPQSENQTPRRQQMDADEGAQRPKSAAKSNIKA